MDNNILSSMKKFLGVCPEYTAFDEQILMYVNSAFSTLKQLGIGGDNGIEVDENTEWSVIITKQRFNFLKAYVNMRVKLMFDPPTSSFALEALKEQINEYEWRIRSEVEIYGQ